MFGDFISDLLFNLRGDEESPFREQVVINLGDLSVYCAAWTQLDDTLSSFNTFGQPLLVAYKSASFLPLLEASLKAEGIPGMLAFLPTILVSTPGSMLPRVLVIGTLRAKDSRCQGRQNTGSNSPR